LAELLFPEWYYGGPFARIANPDVDLPRRASSVILESQRKRTEMDAVVDGARIIAPFHDANTIEDVLMELWSAMGYPHRWTEEERFVYPTIQGLLAILRDRLISKTTRARGRKAAWLTEALSFVDAARDEYAQAAYEAGEQALRRAEDLIAGACGPPRPKRVIHLGPGDASEPRQ
jgi:hypothetical protein